MGETTYVSDWSSVPGSRYELAQQGEREYWSSKDPVLLNLQARYYFYAGYYEWTKRQALLNPFRVDPSRPQNFHIAPDEIEGRRILDVGCGPRPTTLSLVHCAEVHVVDPLADHYRTLQSFGWDFFGSVSPTGAEQLPLDNESFDFVYCWNTLDHTRDADLVLREVARVLRPRGQLLLGCDVRSERGGGTAHPYRWSIDVLQARLLADFEPVTSITLLDSTTGRPVSPDEAEPRVLQWVGRLRKKG